MDDVLVQVHPRIRFAVIDGVVFGSSLEARLYLKKTYGANFVDVCRYFDTLPILDGTQKETINRLIDGQIVATFAEYQGLLQRHTGMSGSTPLWQWEKGKEEND